MSGSRKAIWAVVGAVVLVSTIAGAGGMAISLYANHGQAAQAPKTPASDKTDEAKGPGDLSRFAVGAMAKLQTPAELRPAPNYVFRDRTGTAVRFQAFQGRVTVVNLWAMWCAPCREEMPTLAALAAAYAGNDQVVVAPISVDLPDQVADARAFIADNAPLPFYSDPKFRLPFEFAGKGAMPQTMLLDRQGRVRAHLTGGADWSGPESRALIDALLAEPTS